MEIACRDYQVFIGAHSGIVGGRIYLGVNHRFHVGKRILGRTMHLRYATERIRVLHIRLCSLNYRTAFKQLAHGGGSGYLPTVRAHLVHGIGKRFNKAAICVERHCRNGIGPTAQLAPLKQRPHGKSPHVLSPVEQGKPLLRCQLYGFPPLAPQHIGSRHDFPFIFHLAKPHKRQREVCKRHQVARGTERTLHIHHRVNIIVEEINEPLHGIELAARVTVAERLHLQQQHYLHYLVGHTLASAASVRHHQVDLQLCQVVAAYRHIAQRAESRGHTVNRRTVLGYFFIEVFAATYYAVARIVAKLYFVSVPYNLTHTLYGEMLCRYFMYHKYINKK